MFRADELTLCCGSVAQADLRELLEVASGAGFGGVSLWPTLYRAARDAGHAPGDLRRSVSQGDRMWMAFSPPW